MPADQCSVSLSLRDPEASPSSWTPETTRPSSASEDHSVELRRLAALRRYDILDTPPDGSFDRLTTLAARYFDVPIALISVVDRDRVWFKSRYGLEVEEVGRDPGLCASVILQDEPWVVENAISDPRTLAHPLVAEEFGLGFYAAAPLRTHDGHNLGTFCVLDRRPRSLSDAETEMLAHLAGVVMDELELRLRSRSAVVDASVGALLGALEAKDGYSGSHSREVLELAAAIGLALGSSGHELAEIENVALLHDIGKVGISDLVLLKPGRLDEKEWREMRRHPVIGGEMVEKMTALTHLAPAVRAEHERWDGTGYPDGLAGDRIPLSSRVVLVADAYHAMTTDRPYRRALSPRAARQEIADHTGTQFCPRSAGALLTLV